MYAECVAQILLEVMKKFIGHACGSTGTEELVLNVDRLGTLNASKIECFFSLLNFLFHVANINTAR